MKAEVEDVQPVMSGRRHSLRLVLPATEHYSMVLERQKEVASERSDLPVVASELSLEEEEVEEH